MVVYAFYCCIYVVPGRIRYPVVLSVVVAPVVPGLLEYRGLVNVYQYIRGMTEYYQHSQLNFQNCKTRTEYEYLFRALGCVCG